MCHHAVLQFSTLLLPDNNYDVEDYIHTETEVILGLLSSWNSLV